MSKEEKYNRVLHLAEKNKKLKKEIDALNSQLYANRLNIIEELNRLNEFIVGNIKLTIPKSFDVDSFMVECPLLYDKYCYTETQTTTIFDKKKFEKDQPIMFKKYLKELSPRLTIK